MKRLTTLVIAIVLAVGLVFTATVTEARADSDEPLRPAEVQQVVSRYSAEIQQCYLTHAMPQKRATGKFTVELVIRSSGDVGRVTVDAPGVKGKQLEQCVRELTEAWRFRETRSATLIQSPFLLLRTHAPGAGPIVPRGRKVAGR
jgi:hypothetical protein